ncbi:uncharacterized protein LOC114955381 isoform X1 [Acropora millepora]|uniref:uncharacterized protein LOC114955381 isoform X1 n=1 Tax=Acropora millepora TaxID=45264 RepID=UPI001CF4B9E9|nr:uncharacterized protein LOC114955381 isoform X1 [Acropora millepora]
MAAKSSAYAFITQKVICLLFLQSGLSLSQATSSSRVSGSITIHPTATGNHSTMTSGSSNTTSGPLNATTSSSSRNFSAAISTVMPSPSTSSVAPSQPQGEQDQRNFKRPTDEEIEQTFQSEVFKLNHEFSSEIDPKRDEPIDVDVIDSFTKMMTSGWNLLFRYNASIYHETVDYFNVTESLVITMRKYYCLEEREAVLPDRSNKSRRKELGKVTDTVALKFDCPRIISNDNRHQRSHSRKRREVEMEITMEINADDDFEVDNDYQLYQYHRSRLRRDAAQHQQQQCGPLKCNVKRLDSNLKIIGRWSSNLTNLTSPESTNLTKELKDALRHVLGATFRVEKIDILKYEKSQSKDVTVRLYLDVHDVQRDSNDTTARVTSILQAATNGSFRSPKVEFISLEYVVVVNGIYKEWKEWEKCDSNFNTRRTRECEGSQHGGKCDGHASEERRCDCVFNETKGGNISSPLFPKNYTTNVTCVWFLLAPVNHTVKFFLKEFSLEKDKKCFYDYVEFYDGDNVTSEDHLIDSRMCGSHTPRFINSTGQMLSIVFKSDKSVTGKGFFGVWHPEKIAEKGFVPQYVTALTMIYSPNVNDTHYPLGTATTCSSESMTMDENCKFNTKVYIISRLISAQMGRRLPLAGENRIIINFEHIMNENLFPAMYSGQKYCVYWNSKAKEKQANGAKNSFPTEDTEGSWSRTGCSLVSTNLTHSSCACDHEGLFALLGQEKTHSGKLKLLTNTYIGIGISYFILILAIIHIVWKIEIHGGEVMRINMCAAIISMQTFFLIGAHVKAQQTLCGFLAFAIYFSVLAEFSWLLLHGLRIHGKIKKIFASNLNIEIVYVVIGWGLPLLLALLAIGVKIDSESKGKVCWEAAAGSSMLGYAAPLILISLFNGAVLVKLLIPTQDVKDAYDHRELRFRVFKDFVFLLCFALTCTFAYQAVEEKRFFEQYLLTAFVIMQAVAMFVFGREGRKDFVKRAMEPKPEPETAKEEPEENIYENIYENIQPEPKSSKETDLGEGSPKKRPRKRASNKQAEKITVATLKNLNIYKEGGQYVIEA